MLKDSISVSRNSYHGEAKRPEAFYASNTVVRASSVSNCSSASSPPSYYMDNQPPADDDAHEYEYVQTKYSASNVKPKTNLRAKKAELHKSSNSVNNNSLDVKPTSRRDIPTYIEVVP